jgi:hypothetical protein
MASAREDDGENGELAVACAASDRLQGSLVDPRPRMLRLGNCALQIAAAGRLVRQLSRRALARTRRDHPPERVSQPAARIVSKTKRRHAALLRARSPASAATIAVTASANVRKLKPASDVRSTRRDRRPGRPARLPPLGGNPQLGASHRARADDDALGRRRGEPEADELDHLRGREAMRQHDRFRAAARRRRAIRARGAEWRRDALARAVAWVA